MYSIQLLRMKQYNEALKWLKKCEKFSEKNPKSLAVTYNNIACYYKKLGQNRSALINLEKALELEGSMEDASFKADTHLNTCAVLSQMGYHDLAMHHAQSAIIIIQQNLLKLFLPETRKKSLEKKKEDKDKDNN